MPRAARHWAVWVVALAPAAAAGQPAPAPPQTDPAPGPTADVCRLPDSLRFTLESLGASSGVPDGFGGGWYPAVPVHGQAATMRLVDTQVGLTAPVYTTAVDGLFVTGSARQLAVDTTARLPVGHTRFPNQLTDLQAGGAYVRQLDGGWSWGVYAAAGSASDKPFHSLAEDTISGLAFVRVPRGERDGWLGYVVSTTNGQFGRNLPIPGVAYEFQADRISGIVGFPFLNLTVRPADRWEWDVAYAALTDVSTRLTFRPVAPGRVFAGFDWANQSWLRAGRPDPSQQLFRYEKRVGGGVGWAVGSRLDFRAAGGYAFDRYFVENNGYSITGRNRVDIGNGPFATVQLELRY